MGRKPKNSNTEVSAESTVGTSISDAFQSFLSNASQIESSLEDKFVQIPTGIDIFDLVSGGGIPCKFSMLMGKPGSGKSTLAVAVIKNGQKIWGKDFIAVYADSEESMSQKRLSDLGCKYPVNIVTGLTVEKLFKTVEALCSFKAQTPESIEIPSLIVWDSIANTVTEDSMASEELSNTDGARRASALSRYLPKYIDKLSKYNIALLAINQYRTKLAMGGGPVSADIRNLKQDLTIPGGQSVSFNAFQLFDVDQGPPYKNDPYGIQMAPVKIKAIKNKSFTPNIPVIINFNAHRGFSNFWTNFEFLKTYKYIQTGNFCKLLSMSDVSFRQKQASALYTENAEWRAAFDRDLKKAMDEFKAEYEGGGDNNSWASDNVDGLTDVVSDDTIDENDIETVESEEQELSFNV